MLKVSPIVVVLKDRIGNADSQGLLAGFPLPPIQMRSDLRPGLKQPYLREKTIF